ncbi:cellulose binding domain-containing protein [Micromonospora chaiyaphumensis]|uniref:Cellulose binding domain-containing protein n=1 Tax=Micromonospora chaiyaphumensis TaxID=307119 RepID=A0A1C4VHN3_9ACTN|nr:cellulose binding domain-containing protein [Micromonospora chaiyaphumensis]SCE83440.1 Cellulose binding domain-containing protein [Micromonospora chaiyaphumensis]
MPAPPSPPRRTLPIILLDGLVAAAGAVRRAVVGRRDGSRLAYVAIVAALGVLLATAYSIVTVLRTPERLTPVAVGPGGGVPATEPVVTGTPEDRPAPTVAGPRMSAPPVTTAAPAAPAPPATLPSTGAAPATTSPAPPRPVPLGAAFAVEENALLSYGAAVTIDNPGPASARTWTLVIVLPRESLRVTSVTGARATRDGATWTFVPEEDGGGVPGHGTVRVTFRVNGSALSATPTACTIDGAACTGVPA